MAEQRFKNVNWRLGDEQGAIGTWERVTVAVLMDIRDELQAIRARLDCHETRAIPRYLRRISANTAKPRRKAKR